MWGSTRPENQNNVYNRGYRYSLKKWEDILNKLRLNPMADGIDFSRLIPFLFKFTKNARDCGFQSEDILPLEYIGKAKNIIRRNSDWVKCLTKQKGFHGMLEYFIKYIGEVPHHVHVVGCFDNDRQSLNAEAFVARLLEGITDGAPRYFSSQDGTAFNVAPCGHYGLVRLNTVANTEALKQWKLGEINLDISTHRNWQRYSNSVRAAAKKKKAGIVDLDCPFQNNWRALAANPSQAQQDHRTEFVKRSKTASKNMKEGIVDLNCPIQNNMRNHAMTMNSTLEIDSAAWKLGIRDPKKYPNHKKWLKAGTSKKQTITNKSKFQKQFQNWQKDTKIWATF